MLSSASRSAREADEVQPNDCAINAYSIRMQLRRVPEERRWLISLPQVYFPSKPIARQRADSRRRGSSIFNLMNTPRATPASSHKFSARLPLQPFHDPSWGNLFATRYGGQHNGETSRAATKLKPGSREFSLRQLRFIQALDPPRVTEEITRRAVLWWSPERHKLCRRTRELRKRLESFLELFVEPGFERHLNALNGK